MQDEHKEVKICSAKEIKAERIGMISHLAGTSLRQVAKEFDMSRESLRRLIKELKGGKREKRDP